MYAFKFFDNFLYENGDVVLGSETSKDVPFPSPQPLDLTTTPLDLSAGSPGSLAIQQNLSLVKVTSLQVDLPHAQVFLDRGKKLSSKEIRKSLHWNAR